ncbi:MAG TPA: hypothetical protein VFO14_16475 [Vicinamibacterales bacterium]|nr:hypothetical protein [Vicinamibacterales bacterium]
MAGHPVRPLAADAGGVGYVDEPAVGYATPQTERAASAGRLFGLAGVAGAVVLAAGVVAGVDRAWAGWLLASVGVLTTGLAGLLFVAILYASGASWGVAFRRAPEALSAAIPIGGAALLALVVFAPYGYPWAHGHEFHGGDLANFKRAWLSWPFFAARAVVYVVVWMAFARAIIGHSHRQDQDADAARSIRNIRLSIAFLVAFAVTFSLASFDWIMSIEPEWYSTIFGIYNFAGLFSGGLASIVLLVVWLQRGPLKHVVTEQHLHDLGKLLFAFCTFWMYIWFSQYMLIWYANIPEETTYYIARTRGAYEVLFSVNMVLNWVVPFFALLRRGPKKRSELIVKVAVVVLLGRWLDLYMMIVPPFSPSGPPFGLWEIAAILAMVGVAVWVALRALGRARLVPVNDPRLDESLHYHA